MFNQPQAGGGYFDSKSHLGSLILVTKVHEVYHNSMNVYQGKPSPRDEAKVDVVDLSQDGVLHERIVMTHPGLVNRLSTGATNILGRVNMHTGSNGDYYALDEYQPQDVDLATRWVQQWQAGQMQQPGGGGQNGPQGAPQQQGAPQGGQGGYGAQSGQQAPQGQGYGQQPQQQGPPQQQGGYQQGPPQGQMGNQQPQQGQGDPWGGGQQGGWGGAPQYDSPPFN